MLSQYSTDTGYIHYSTAIRRNKKGSFGDDLHNIRIPRPKGAANTNEARNYDTHVLCMCIIMYLKASVIFLPLYFCRRKIQSLNPFAPCHFQIMNELLLNFENISMLHTT